STGSDSANSAGRRARRLACSAAAWESSASTCSRCVASIGLTVDGSLDPPTEQRLLGTVGGELGRSQLGGPGLRLVSELVQQPASDGVQQVIAGERAAQRA